MAEAPANLVVYTVDPESKSITRSQSGDTEHVANFNPDTGILNLLEGHEKYRIPIIRHLNDKGWKYKGLTDEALKKDESIPKPPRFNPRLGDKTPAYVQWLARFKRKEFMASFGIRKLQILVGHNEWIAEIRNEETGQWMKVPQKEPIYEDVDHLDYDVSKLLQGDQRLLAERKSVITHKVGLEEDDDLYDWDSDATVDDRRADGGDLKTTRMIRG